MSNKDVNMSIVVEAKTQYTKQLINILKDNVYHVLKNEFINALKISEDSKRILFNFQSNLKSIRVWNSDIIKKETEKLLDKCSYLNEIITAVFISNIRILTSIKIDKSKKKLKITIPSNETFVHKVFVTSAKYVFENPFMFRNNKNSENTSEIYKWIVLAIEETIFELLPIKELLDSYLNEDKEEEVSEEETVEVSEEEEEEEQRENIQENDNHVKNSSDEHNVNEFEGPLETEVNIDNKNENSFFAHPPDEEDEIKTVNLNYDRKSNTYKENPENKEDPKTECVPTFFDDVTD